MFFFTISYINLQDAHVSEANKLGDWQTIGYEAPGSKASSNEYKGNIFTYTGAIKGETTTATEAAWKAVTGQALNDCAKDKAWSLKASIGTTNGGLVIEDGADTESKCRDLTASWTNLFRKDTGNL